MGQAAGESVLEKFTWPMGRTSLFGDLRDLN